MSLFLKILYNILKTLKVILNILLSENFLIALRFLIILKIRNILFIFSN
jgi:hypothetical protein